jgi:diadenosine tetraphosphatase ApaH/serine/threonine PP2A family protein phosphatase
VNKNYGFQHDVLDGWGNLKLWTAINGVFSYLPLTAVLNGNCFCVHGGLSPQVSSLKMLQRVKRPIVQYEKDDLTCDLVWSDPSTDTPDFLRSNRGSGVTFGTNSVRDFFKATKMKHIIRAHQCVPYGVERFDGDRVYTVFSCSNYADSDGNRCGILYLNPQGELESFSLPPLTIPARNETLFGDSCDGTERKESLALNLKQADLKERLFENYSGMGGELPLTRSRQITLKTRSRSVDCFCPGAVASGVFADSVGHLRLPGVGRN